MKIWHNDQLHKLEGSSLCRHHEPHGDAWLAFDSVAATTVVPIAWGAGVGYLTLDREGGAVMS